MRLFNKRFVELSLETKLYIVGIFSIVGGSVLSYAMSGQFRQMISMPGFIVGNACFIGIAAFLWFIDPSEGG